MKIKIKKKTAKRQSHFAILGLLILVALAGCAKKKAAQLADKIEGTLTIDDKNFPLQYVYARRAEAIPDKRESSIEILLANEKIPEATLAKLFGYLLDDTAFSYYDIMQETPIRALHLRIYKNQGYKDGAIAFYPEMFLPDDTIQVNTDHEFEAFDLKKRIIKAKAKNEWEQRDYSGGALKDVKYSYSFAFETSLMGANTKAEANELASAPPEEGAADGTMKTNDEVSPLKFAYACKEKIFFDEPEVVVKLLITDKPLPEKNRLEAFQSLSDLVYELELQGTIEITLDQFGRIKGGYVRSRSGTLSTNWFAPKECALEIDRVNGSFHYDKPENSSIDFDVKDFSVTFAAPLRL